MGGNPFAWVRELLSGRAKDASPDGAGPTVSLADLKRRGMISAEMQDVGEQALEQLKRITQRYGWKLGPRFGRGGVWLRNGEGRTPLALIFAGGRVHLAVCVRGIEDPVAQAELPREFTLTFENGDYKGMALKPGRTNLGRYVSVLANSVRLGKC